MQSGHELYVCQHETFNEQNAALCNNEVLSHAMYNIYTCRAERHICHASYFDKCPECSDFSKGLATKYVQAYLFKSTEKVQRQAYVVKLFFFEVKRLCIPFLLFY